MDNQTSNIAVRETEINRVMNDLTNVVECLTQSIEATETRLTRVTISSRPSESNTEQGDTLYETALAQDINKIHSRIQCLRERLDDLLNRIEL